VQEINAKFTKKRNEGALRSFLSRAKQQKKDDNK
jgi:hypothetical protein